MRFFVRLAVAVALFWVGLGLAFACAPDSMMMMILPCSGATHEIMLCPMALLDNNNSLWSALAVIIPVWPIIAPALMLGAIVYFIFPILDTESAAWCRRRRAKIFVSLWCWCQIALRQGLMQPKIFA